MSVVVAGATIPTDSLVEARGRGFMPLRKYVASSVVEEMRRGSFERVAESVATAVRRDRALFAQAFGEEVRPLATFKGRAIVATSAGRFFRTEWKESEDGQVRFTKVEQIADVPVQSFREVAEQALRRVARLVMENKTEDAARELRESRALLTYAGVTRPSDLARLLREHLDQSRPWRRYVASRGEGIRGFLKLSEGEVAPAQAKYRAVWEDESGDPSSMNDAIRAEATGLLTRLSAICEDARKSYDEYAKSLPAFRGLSEDETPAMFETFSGDFFAEAAGALDTAAAVIQGEDARASALAHDAVLEHAHEFELAGKFIKAMSENLTNGRSDR
jgi:hypothetical protein